MPEESKSQKHEPPKEEVPKPQPPPLLPTDQYWKMVEEEARKATGNGDNTRKRLFESFN